MPSALRLRLALFTLLGVFLIPIGTSSLQGLTHVLTCSENAEIPFTVVMPRDGPPTVVSSRTYEAGAPEGVCGGLVLDLRVVSDRPGRLLLDLPITNRSGNDWQGTVKLHVGKTAVPVSIGRIPAGGTSNDRVPIDVEPGTLELNGSLLIGP